MNRIELIAGLLVKFVGLDRYISLPIYLPYTDTDISVSETEYQYRLLAR